MEKVREEGVLLKKSGKGRGFFFGKNAIFFLLTLQETEEGGLGAAALGAGDPGRWGGREQGQNGERDEGK